MSEQSEGVPTTVRLADEQPGAEATSVETTNTEPVSSDPGAAAEQVSSEQVSSDQAPTDPVPADADASSSDSDRVRSVAQLEEEGDIAADYIEELLDITDLDGDIDIEARDGRAYVSVNSSTDSNLRLLSKPDTVTALQELTRIAVQTKTGAFSRLILDVGGSREAREAELAKLVRRAAERISEGAASVDLPPMSSYERKLVHDLVAAEGLHSESEGEGRDRHTVITAIRV